LATFPGRPWFGFNRLEEVVLPQHPELSRLLLMLREEMPVAMMTGSGSAVFGVLRSAGRGEELIQELGSSLEFARLVEPSSRGVIVLEG
jgi:4-diphosphocytidyl-2C-methyl-D-erythritol kinase